MCFDTVDEACITVEIPQPYRLIAVAIGGRKSDKGNAHGERFYVLFPGLPWNGPFERGRSYGTSYCLITIYTELQLAAFLLCRIALST